MNTVEHVQDVHGVWVLFSVLVPRFDDVHYGRVLRGGHHGESFSFYHIYVWAIGLTARVFCLLQDTYVSRYTLVIAGLCECLFVGWHYGAERLREETRRVSSSFKSYLRNL